MRNHSRHFSKGKHFCAFRAFCETINSCGGFIARRNRRNRSNIICSAISWYAQPLEAFFRRKTFLRFLRFLRDHYFSRRVYSTQIAQIAQKLYLLCKYLVCTLQEHFSEGKHFCYFCYFLRPVGSKRHPSGCRALRDLKKLRGKSLRSQRRNTASVEGRCLM